MKRYKFQALVTVAASDREAQEKLSAGSHRMVLRAENSETKRTQVFSALVDPEEGTFRPGKPEIMVTLRVIGDDVVEKVGGRDRRARRTQDADLEREQQDRAGNPRRGGHGGDGKGRGQGHGLSPPSAEHPATLTAPRPRPKPMTAKFAQVKSC